MKSYIFSSISRQYRGFVSYHGILIASAILYQISLVICNIPYLITKLIASTPKILARNIGTYFDRLKQMGALLWNFSFSITFLCVLLYSFKELSLFIYEAGNHIYNDFNT